MEECSRFHGTALNEISTFDGIFHFHWSIQKFLMDDFLDELFEGLE